MHGGTVHCPGGVFTEPSGFEGRRYEGGERSDHLERRRTDADHRESGRHAGKTENVPQPAFRAGGRDHRQPVHSEDQQG